MYIKKIRGKYKFQRKLFYTNLRTEETYRRVFLELGLRRVDKISLHRNGMEVM